jgi:hypothetical protein
VKLQRRNLHEYGGYGGRVAGARHPYRLPLSTARTAASIPQTKEQKEKRLRRDKRRIEVRERMRKLVREQFKRRPLQTISG